QILFRISANIWDPPPEGDPGPDPPVPGVPSAPPPVPAVSPPPVFSADVEGGEVVGVASVERGCLGRVARTTEDGFLGASEAGGVFSAGATSPLPSPPPLSPKSTHSSPTCLR